MATTLSSRSEKTKPGKVPKNMPREADPPNENEIRLLAYRLYEKRLVDGVSGDAAEDWIEAERLLTEGPGEGAELD